MLILYTKGGCQFSRKVLFFAEINDIALITKDIYADPKNVEELVAHGGKRQVPYLIDEEKGVAMYESDDIIEHLKAHYVK